jgi:signal transduction histidine kinase/ActR/RegA family two-component response regulator
MTATGPVRKTDTAEQTATLAEVDIRSELLSRPPRTPNLAAEDRALTTLAREMAENPRNMLQKLVEMAVELCNADTAGISLLEGQVFRWEAVAGVFASHRNGTMPRAASPCGVCIDQNLPQLMHLPDRCFPALRVEPRFVEALLIPFHDHGAPVGTVWVVSHTFERKFDREDERIMRTLSQFASAGWQLWKACAAAEEVGRRKDEFLATLSHELRTPLSSILGWVRLLRSGRLDRAASDRAIEVIERNTLNLGQLVTDLLDVSGIIAGKATLNIAPVDLGKVIELAIDSLRPTATAKGITIHSGMSANVPALLGDADRLQQIVWNLVSNAVKFTPKGGSVEIKMTERSEGARITVSDTGEGIAPGFLPHLFERFRQADSTTTRMRGGLGLGLAIVWHIVELHGGAVRAESAGIGKGATFVVDLPYARAAIAASSALVDGAQPAPVTAVLLQGVRVLVVDDSPETRELLTLILEQQKAQVLSATSASEALTLFEVTPPDVLVCDIAMPDTDGYQLIRQIRAGAGGASSYVSAIALTAYARPEDRVRALRAGFDEYLAKPVEPAEFVDMIARLTEKGLG